MENEGSVQSLGALLRVWRSWPRSLHLLEVCQKPRAKATLTWGISWLVARSVGIRNQEWNLALPHMQTSHNIPMNLTWPSCWGCLGRFHAYLLSFSVGGGCEFLSRSVIPMARRRCLWTLPSMRQWSWPHAIKACPGPKKGIAFDECFRTIWSEENVRIYEIYYPNPYYKLFASRLHPYFPPYFVWFWNLSQLSWWIAPLMRFGP